MVNTAVIIIGISLGYVVKNPNKITKAIINILSWGF